MKNILVLVQDYPNNEGSVALMYVGVYTIIKEELKKKVNVLFIGLPCQVAAIKQYVGGNLEEAYLTHDKRMSK